MNNQTLETIQEVVEEIILDTSLLGTTRVLVVKHLINMAFVLGEKIN
jgi:hypothetical protein